MGVCVDDCYIFGTSKKLIEEFTTSFMRPDPRTKMKYQLFDDGFDYALEELLVIEAFRSGKNLR